MTYETRIREHLMAKGHTNSEASREAFNAINAIMDGEIQPETAETEYGITQEEYTEIYTWMGQGIYAYINKSNPIKADRL